MKSWWWANSRNSRVFNFAILVKLRKFHAREIEVFYSIQRSTQRSKVHLCVPCPRSYLAYATLISTFYYYYPAVIFALMRYFTLQMPLCWLVLQPIASVHWSSESAIKKYWLWLHCCYSRLTSLSCLSLWSCKVVFSLDSVQGKTTWTEGILCCSSFQFAVVYVSLLFNLDFSVPS